MRCGVMWCGVLWCGVVYSVQLSLIEVNGAVRCLMCVVPCSAQCDKTLDCTVPYHALPYIHLN